MKHEESDFDIGSGFIVLQCWFILMNEKILEIACKKVEHILLVNTFMKLLEFEKKVEL